MTIEIIKAKHCGFCSGVKRAVSIAERAAANGNVYTMGPIIHNPQFVDKLIKKGIIPIDNIEDNTKPCSVLIRSHGITVEEETALKSKGVELIDATCPKVKRAHRICETFAENYDTVFIIGAETHPEVKGIMSRAPGKAIVISSVEQAKKLPKIEAAGLLVQTTFRKEKFIDIASEILKKTKLITINNTICEETDERQSELKEIAAEVDMIIVVGGKNSSNTKRLFELASELKETYHIEISDEINYNCLKGKTKVGIVTGASTPLDLVETLEEKLNKKNK